MATIKLAPLCAAVAITASGVFLIASPSAAKERPVVVQAPADEAAPTRKVSYADLNLAVASGEKALHRRVRKAVMQVCDGSNPGADKFELRDCRGYAWTGARPQIARALERARAGIAVAGGADAGSITIVVASRS